VTVSATDNGVTGSTTFTWIVNDSTAPAVNNPGTQTNFEGDTITPLTITAVDNDPNTFTATGLPTGLTISAAGVISGTIDPHAGLGTPYTVTVSATDNGVKGSTTFTWVVKAVPPTVNNPGPQTNNEGATITPLTITATGADPNTFTATGLPTGLSISPAGVISGTIDPRAASGSPYSVTVSAKHDGATGSTMFTWTVNDTTAPALTNPGTQTNNLQDAINLQLTFTDADTFTDNGTMPPGLSVSNTGLISGSFLKSDTGSYAVTITATDGTAKTSVSFTWSVNTRPNATTVVLGTDGSLIEFTPTVSGQALSPPHTIQKISTVQDGFGVTAVYAIVTGAAGPQYNNTLWENYNGVWSQKSTGQFQQISAATAKDGSAVVFAVLADGSLWEQHTSAGVDTGWAQLSPAGTVKSISAVTDVNGNEECYAIVTGAAGPQYNNTLWLHGPAFPGGWVQISSGQFQQISAGLNAAGQALMYGVLTNGKLWEQNPAFGPIGLDMGFHQLSDINGLPSSFLSVQAGGPDKVFGVEADHTVWEHGPAGNMQISPILLTAQVSATQTPSGADEVFMTLIDGEFWEFSSVSGFQELLPSGAASSSTPH
jgi:hypothetical protein